MIGRRSQNVNLSGSWIPLNIQTNSKRASRKVSFNRNFLTKKKVLEIGIEQANEEQKRKSLTKRKFVDPV